MFSKVPVGDVMTRQFISVSPNTNLLECSRRLIKKKVSSLLVTDKNKLLGILTAKDILWAITKKPNLNLKEVEAIDIATRKVAVIKPSADIAQAFQKMRRHGFRRLPVLSKGNVVGIITLKDILNVEPLLYNKTGELFNLKEEERKLQATQQTYQEGLCENCGSFAELLKIDTLLLCPDCREELY